ncbi:putative bifunctional diguanylate cyclase/phosphodiesterase [Vibrio penaeicida]|uniref:putative bifunctional diguanylate cyclase/phosphodiesterase n=1 Tax=Vibrio penaeicida TaxID=104609 RepID=UPI000CEA5650|nr:EAL domain-containing protein [Vibrio penaeicida]
MKYKLIPPRTTYIWLTGILVALLCFYTISFYEGKRAQYSLELKTNEQIEALENAINALKTVLHSTRDFLQISNELTSEQFHKLLRDRTGIGSGIHTIFWAPLISTRHPSESNILKIKSNQLGYVIHPEISTNYACSNWLGLHAFPVLYASPKFEGSEFLGKRLESHCPNNKALRRAIEINEAKASTFYHEGKRGLQIYLPVQSSQGQTLGILVMNIILQEFLELTWQDEFLAKNIEIIVQDDNKRELFQMRHSDQKDNLFGLLDFPSVTRNLYFPTLDKSLVITTIYLDTDYRPFIYGAASSFLIFMLTLSVSVSVKSYANRLQVSNKLVAEKTQKLRVQATHDSLTGLFNRQALAEQLEDFISQITPTGGNGFAILFIDLNRFKIVNDSMGHTIGDLLLQQVAQRLINNVRNDDICYRFGGDEFIVCLRNKLNRYDVSNICQRYLTTLTEPYYCDGLSYNIGASIGVTTVNSSTQTLTNILREADTAMYRAKKSPTDHVVFYDDTMFDQAKQRFTVENELSEAHSKKQLLLYYQPVFSVSSDTVTAFEALLRWDHPEKGWISPAVFIPVAEETDQIIEIGDWILDEVCATIQQIWDKSVSGTCPRINVNVSVKQLKSGHIVKTLRSVLKKYRFPNSLLGIEITESTLLNHTTASNTLKQIKSLGVSLYLDDFGTGYSSLAVLNDYPFDVVKMDRSFIWKLNKKGDKSSQLCEAIIKMSHSINLTVVAEGVETQAQFDMLKSYQCDYIQGFLKGKPVAKSEMSRFIASSSAAKQLSNIASKHKKSENA